MMKINRVLFVHIGLPKTGTSAQQVFFARNVKRLYQKGLRYPGVNEKVGSEEKISSGNGQRIAREAFVEGADEQPSVLGLLDRALGAGDRNVLISSEFFSDWDAEQYAKLKAYAGRFNYDVKVILYLRDQADIAVTHYFQNLKRREGYIDITGENFEKYALKYAENQKYLNFDYLLTMLSLVYGRENVIARTAKRSCLVGESLFLDSLDALGIADDKGFDKNIAKINPTPSQQEMYIRAMMGVFMPSLKTSDAYLKIVSQIHDKLGQTGNKNDNFFIEPSVVQNIRDRFSESNKSVCKEWFGGRDVSEVLDRKNYGEKISYDNNSMAINSIIAVFAGMIVNLQNRVEILETPKKAVVTESPGLRGLEQKPTALVGMVRRWAKSRLRKPGHV